MKIVWIDASKWRNATDAIHGRLYALGRTGIHGGSEDAFVDSMIYGGMLDTQPPYEVVVKGLEDFEAAAFIGSLAYELEEARRWRKAEYGDDVEVSVTVEK